MPQTFWTPSRAGLFVALLVAVAASAQGCDCSGCDPVDIAPIPIADCRISDGRDTSCGGDREAYRFGKCVASGCEADSDCCPGTRCRLDFNACVPNQLDPEFQCDEDEDCPDPAMGCREVELGERAAIAVCAYQACAGDGDCEQGRVCFHNVCVETAPCGGGCPDGEACDVATGRCSPTPEDSIRCHDPCGAFELMVLQNPSTMTGDICCAISCQCKALPPLIPVSYGRYARVEATTDEIFVSAYDSQYGDLVVIHYKSDGSWSHIEYVDGVPLGGAQVADPNGPRKGVGEPGPDVGTHTSIAADSNNRVRVAYHDVDNRLLKVALQQEDGTWTTYPLDNPGGEGSVGTFTDLDIDPQTGTIYISYLALEVVGAPTISGAASGVKLARSRGPNPTGPGDWDIFWVDARPTYDPCDGDCMTGQACVLDGGEAVCANETTGCATSCSSNEFCTEAQPEALCRATAIPPSVLDFPKARGLYSSVTADGPNAHLAYYDSIDGDLRTATLNSAGAATVAVLDGDGEDGHRGGDVGRFPHVRKLGDDLFVVYEDFTRHELRAWQGADASAAGTFSTVDIGKISGDPGKRFVGAGARVDFDDNDNPVVVYQDATQLDLKLARRDNGTWAPSVIVEDGAHGFYSDVKVQGGSAFIVSVEAKLDGRGRERSRAALTVQALP